MTTTDSISKVIRPATSAQQAKSEMICGTLLKELHCVQGLDSLYGTPLKPINNHFREHQGYKHK
jgi:hypothetical protein